MKRFITLLLAFTAVQTAFGWGQKGHDVTAYIAECNLTPEAAEKIDKIFDGHSIVYYANWMDTASHTLEYAYSRTWHYANIDDGYDYDTMTHNPDGDVITAINTLSEKLKAGGLDHVTEALYLKMLVHLVGDIHAPMHSGHLSDVGGNTVPVMMFSRSSNLHSVWDTAIPEAAHKWSYTEWQNQIDRASDDEVVMIQSGTPLDWLLEGHEICKQIYVDTPAGTKIEYNYIAKYTPVIEQQLLRGGLRLAKLLNEIYG